MRYSVACGHRRVARARLRTRGPVRDIVHHYDLATTSMRRRSIQTMTYSSAVFATDDMTLGRPSTRSTRGSPRSPTSREGHRVLGSARGGAGRHLPRPRPRRRCHHDDRLREQATHVEKLAGRGETGRSPPRGAPRLPRGRRHVRSRRVRGDDRVDPGAPLGGVSAWSATGSRRTAAPACRSSRSPIAAGPVGSSNPDFVRRYIFPGGQAPSPGVLRRCTRRGPRVDHEHRVRPPPHAWLRAWRDRSTPRGPTSRSSGTTALPADVAVAPLVCERGFREQAHRREPGSCSLGPELPGPR